MKKILIWLLLFNIIVFSEEIDLLKQMDDSKYEENAVNFFLDTIRKKNNLLVIKANNTAIIQDKTLLTK